MHCDEAVHADKFGTLLEQGTYEYSTVDFHGPTLYYLTLLPAWVQGAHRYSDLSEVTLRIVPAVAGVLLVAAHFLLVPYVGLPAAFSAALLAAISPATVYYSRYYIHESLLIFFTFGALLSTFAYYHSRRALWAVAAGFWVGLMYATKETTIIALASAVLAMIAVRLSRIRGGESTQPAKIPKLHLMLAGVAAIVVPVLLFSTFLARPRGIADSLLAYCTYFERGLGHNTLHVHPWHYYLDLLLYFHLRGGPYWTEGLVVFLALVGFFAALRRKTLGVLNPEVLKFLAFYTLILLVIYSLIPYKVPWNLLGFLHGITILAGLGIARLMAVPYRRAGRVAAVAILAAAGLHLGWQAWAGSFRYEADPCNPWVYAHTGRDIFEITRRVQDLAQALPDGLAVPIQIVSRENLWPLPWYLRRFSAVRWWNGVSESAPSAPIILATPDMEPALVRKLYELPPPGQREMYMNIFDRYVELRPRVELRGYAVKWLWDDYQRLQFSSGPDSRPERK